MYKYHMRNIGREFVRDPRKFVPSSKTEMQIRDNLFPKTRKIDNPRN